MRFHLDTITLIFYNLFSLATTHTISNPLYTAIAPNTIRPNNPYQVLVTIHDAESTVNVEVSLNKVDKTGENSIHAKEALEKGETKLIVLDFGDWGQGEYSLSVVGRGGLDFNKTEGVHYRQKTFSVFIQTDKATYKPGQTVHYRILAVDSTLKPIETNNATVYIEDSRRNRIKQWSGVSFTNGVFSEDLKLADQVILGVWRIIARVKHITQTKEFSINEYVLPTFEVKISAPVFVNYKKPKEIITVFAKYTYGEPVKGQLFLDVSDYYCKYPCHSSYVKQYSVNNSIDGKVDIPIDFVKDLNLPSWMQYGNKVSISAVVVEELTGQRQRGEAEVQISDSEYAFQFSKAETFKPGLPFSITLTASLQDGRPIEEPLTNVTIKCTSSLRVVAIISRDLAVGGEITLSFIPPVNSENLHCEASCVHGNIYAYIQKSQSLSNKYIELSMSKTKVKIGDELEFKIQSTTKIVDPLLVSVIGRGQILHWTTVQPLHSKFHTFTLKVEADMVPKARVVVYYVTFCGEVISDAIDFAVDGIFKTPVELSLSINETSPGTPLDLTVSTHPNAFIGLLAVDKKVLLLKSGNDITTEQILNDLQDYEVGERSYFRFDRRKRSDEYWIPPWRPTSTSTLEMFSHVGLLFFTNGLLVQNYASGFAHKHHAESDLDAEAQSTFEGIGTFSLPEPERIRSFFPETFLWVNGTASAEGSLTVNAITPDSITSYSITAFALDKEHGLGLTKSPVTFKNFQTFFMVLNLPYSIVRGETLYLQVLVFNYLKQDVETQVTFDNKHSSFVFVELDNAVELDSPQAKQLTKTVHVKAGEGTSVSFLITAKKLGYVDVDITAKSKHAADAVSRKLLVKAEGTTQYFSRGVFIDLTKEKKFEEEIAIEISDKAVTDSEHIEASAIVDIMGSTVNNLDKLLRLPTGCGEQNLAKFVPNIAILEYLAKTNKLTSAIRDKAIRFTETGYQRQLTYKRYDHSFSVFGQSDLHGSTWLTAAVVKSFLQAKPYITIDDSIIKGSLTWLAQLQTVNGTFPEHGSVWSRSLQGASGEKLSLTAYVLSAFLDSKSHGIEIEVSNETNTNSVIRRTVSYLEKELEYMTSDYDMVIVTYVLHLAGSPSKDKAFAMVNKRAKFEHGLKYWANPNPKANLNRYDKPAPVDVEITAYVLLTYILRGEFENAFPIMRWLVSKRNENGGFESTQDTIMATQALAKFAEKMSSADGINLDVIFTYDSGKQELHLSNENALVLQKAELPRETRHVKITADGTGVGIAQITWFYNVLSVPTPPAFLVNANATADENRLSVKACAKYIHEDFDGSDMAVIEVGVPSGYVIDTESLPEVNDHTRLKRVDTKNGDTVMLVYLNSITDLVCVTVNAHRRYKVAEVRPALIEVYDYYDPVKRGEVLYEAPKVLSVCELCESDICKKQENCN